MVNYEKKGFVNVGWWVFFFISVFGILVGGLFYFDGVLDGKSSVKFVDCYDNFGNVINGVVCEEVYYEDSFFMVVDYVRMFFCIILAVCMVVSPWVFIVLGLRRLSK